MNRVSAGLAARGIRVARFEFSYMAKRRTEGRRGAPDREPALRARWKEAIAELGGGPRVVIGGKSMGGRIASMVADEVEARGLVCFGYPFHPPGQPERLRTAHLADLRTPALFLQGTRDQFGTREDVAAYTLSRRRSASRGSRAATTPSSRPRGRAAPRRRTSRRRSRPPRRSSRAFRADLLGFKVAEAIRYPIDRHRATPYGPGACETCRHRATYELTGVFTMPGEPRASTRSRHCTASHGIDVLFLAPLPGISRDIAIGARHGSFASFGDGLTVEGCHVQPIIIPRACFSAARRHFFASIFNRVVFRSLTQAVRRLVGLRLLCWRGLPQLSF